MTAEEVESSAAMPAGRASDEDVEVVDRYGRVIGSCSRREVRAANRRHRATYVVVSRADGAVLAHRRAPWKDIWPSRWDVAFGGVCAPGERFADAAARELAEECALVAPLVDLGPVVFESAATRVVGRVFAATWEGEAGDLAAPDGEVVEMAWVPRGDLVSFAARRPLCEDSAAVVLPLVQSPRVPPLHGDPGPGHAGPAAHSEPDHAG